MIIECVNCNKKFNVNSELIPKDGRQIKCGSCDHNWHFKKNNSLKKLTTITNKITELDSLLNENEIEQNESISITETTKLPENLVTEKGVNTEINLNHPNRNNGKKMNNFFSYLIVFIVSFVAFIILIDTLKSPLINLLPELEIILFNLFETLKDIKLFIIDLT